MSGTYSPKVQLQRGPGRAPGEQALVANFLEMGWCWDCVSALLCHAVPVQMKVRRPADDLWPTSLRTVRLWSKGKLKRLQFLFAASMFGTQGYA